MGEDAVGEDAVGEDAAEPLVRYHEGPYGRMRSRSVGRPDGRPEIVLVQGMAVANYLIPGVRALGAVTRVHLVELPGLAGSGDPPYELGLADYAAAVSGWVAAQVSVPVVLAGHSAGTQVATTAAADGVEAAGLILAGPTVDPAYRSWPGLVRAFLANGRAEPDGPTRSHLSEWRRAGPRRLYRFVAMSLAHPPEPALEHVRAPVLVLRGAADRISTAAWARSLAGPEPGRYVELPGAHSFVWQRPGAWVPAVRAFLSALPVRTTRASRG